MATWNRILDEGGLVLVAIIVTSVVAWSMLFWKWMQLRGEYARVMQNDGSTALVKGPGIRQVVELWMRGERGRLEDGLGPIHALAALLPLLGLLGTVMGMLKTFDVIKVEGTGDPRLLADGIRQALLTTQAGILAALPVLLGLRFLSSRADRLTSRIEIDLHAAAFGRGNVAAGGKS